MKDIKNSVPMPVDFTQLRMTRINVQIKNDVRVRFSTYVESNWCGESKL